MDLSLILIAGITALAVFVGCRLGLYVSYRKARNVYTSWLVDIRKSCTVLRGLQQQLREIIDFELFSLTEEEYQKIEKRFGLLVERLGKIENQIPDIHPGNHEPLKLRASQYQDANELCRALNESLQYLQKDTKRGIEEVQRRANQVSPDGIRRRVAELKKVQQKVHENPHRSVEFELSALATVTLENDQLLDTEKLQIFDRRLTIAEETILKTDKLVMYLPYNSDLKRRRKDQEDNTRPVLVW